MVENHHPDCSINVNQSPHINFDTSARAGPAGGVEAGEAGTAGMPPILAGELPTERGRSNVKSGAGKDAGWLMYGYVMENPTKMDDLDMISWYVSRKIPMDDDWW